MQTQTIRRFTSGTAVTAGFLLAVHPGSLVRAQGAPLDRAFIQVDFGQSTGFLPRTERFNNLTDFDLFVAQRPGDVAFLNSQGLHGSVYRVSTGAGS